MMNTQTNYGNWVPEKMFPPLFGGGAVLLAAGLIVGGISCILSRALFAALPKQAGRQRRGSPFRK